MKNRDMQVAVAVMEACRNAVMDAPITSGDSNEHTRSIAFHAGAKIRQIDLSAIISALSAVDTAPAASVLDVDAAMEKVQEFASAWALVGGRFDDGSGMEHAETIKTQLRAMLAAATGGAQTSAARGVIAERQRQISVEGWTPEHDDAHADYKLSSAAGCYAMFTLAYPAGDPPPFWPWDKSWWKPSADQRRNLIKAGALILAEIERLDRAALASKKGGA